MLPNIYNIEVPTITGVSVPLTDYKDKVIMIVNTASECGFTPQLKELEEIYEKYKSQGFVVLGFPSNDFGSQEPLEKSDLMKFCFVNFGVKFPIFDKVRVRGNYAHDLFKFLSTKKLNGKFSSTPRWNFHKFLINKNGQVVDFFYPFTKPTSSKITKQIERLLAIPAL